MSRTTLLFITSLGFSAASFASDATIEEIVVMGKFLSIDKVNSVKTPTPILDVPQSLTLLTRAQIEDQSFGSMGDILRYTPGVSVSQGEGHRDAVIIRGIQTTADFFIDGVRDDIEYYRPLYNVEQIEVLRGANALLFGRGGGGGVINRVQKKAEFDDSFTQVNASTNTLDAYTAAIDTNVSTSDNTAFRLNAYYQEHANHRENYSGESYAINPTLSFRLNDDTVGLVSYERVADDRIVDRGVPSQNVIGGPDVPLEGFDETFFGSERGNNMNLSADIFRARVDHDLSDQVRADVTVQYANYDKAYQNLYAAGAVNVNQGVFTDVLLDGYRDTTLRENFIIQANLVGEFDAGNLHNTLLFGVETGQQQTQNARQDNVFAINNDSQLVVAFSDPLVIPDFAYTNLVRDRESELAFTSIYLQDQIDVTDKLKVLVGLRYDEFDINVFDIIEANDGDATGGNFGRRDAEVTPRYGLIYKPLKNLSIYASHSQTFLPRSGDQFLTLNLDTQSTRPQFFENDELGVKWDIRDDLSFTFALFDLERESYTSVDPEDPAQVIVIEGSQTRGYEMQLTGRINALWSVTSGYSRLDGRVNRTDGSGANGNKTRQTPDHMFSIWNSLEVNSKLRFGLGANYQDSFFVNEDNSVEVPDYVRIDAAAFYQVNADLRLQVNIENLLDVDYFPDAHSNDNISTGAPVNARFSAIYAL
jgi:catecholate siderophore receptor